MAVIFLWQFPPLYFAIFSGNSNPDSLFLLFGLPESPNGNSHPYFLPFYPKRAILAPYFCYFARRNGLEAAQAQPASGKQRQNGVGRPAEAARPQQKERQSTYRSTSRSSRSTSSTSSTNSHGRAQKKRQPFRLSSFWSGKRGSDPRPQPWQGCALPTELFPRSVSRLGLQIYNDILNPQKNLQFFRENYTSIEVLNSRRNLKSFSK